jgi:hypothetical protein
MSVRFLARYRFATYTSSFRVLCTQETVPWSLHTINGRSPKREKQKKGHLHIDVTTLPLIDIKCSLREWQQFCGDTRRNVSQIREVIVQHCLGLWGVSLVAPPDVNQLPIEGMDMPPDANQLV